MLYDPENREVYFSTEMIQSEADANASYEHFKAYQQACINNPGIMFKNQMRDADGVPSNAKTAVGVIAGIAFILCIIAAVLCIVGIGFISLDGSLTMRFGDAMTLVCAVFYALHIILVSQFAQGRNIYVLTMWQFVGVAICSLIVGGLFEPMPDWAAVPMDCWISLAYLAVACTTVALLFQNIGQAHLPPASAALLLSLESVFGVVFSVALGAETLTLRIVFGFALVFAAIIVSEVLPERAKR